MMQECQIPREEILPGAVHVRLEGAARSLERAREAASSLAHTYGANPELISWYDRGHQDFSPREECKEGLPGWVAYARAHGGSLTVDVNHEEYVFIFRGVGLFP